MTRKSVLAQIAHRQHGVLTRPQALAAGVGRHTIQTLLSSGALVAEMPAVYRWVGAPTTWHSRVMAAALWAGVPGGASHLTAGQLWKLDGIPGGAQELEVLTGAGTHLHRAGVRAHTSRHLDRGDFTRRHGIPVTDLARTLMDLASVLTAEKLELAITSARRINPNIIAWLEKRVATAADRIGRKGLAVISDMLRGLKHGPDDSALETRVLRRLKRRGLHLPVTQQEICDRDGLIARVDFFWPEEGVVLFADGFRFHENKAQWQTDIAQRNRLMAEGYRVRVVTWDEVGDDGWLAWLATVLRPTQAQFDLW